MVIFLNKIIFLLQVKDSSLATNLCQENPSRCGPMSAAERLALSWGQWGGTGGSQAARPPRRSLTCGRLICMIITIMDPLWCQPPHLTECSITLIAAGKPEQGLEHRVCKAQMMSNAVRRGQPCEANPAEELGTTRRLGVTLKSDKGYNFGGGW